MDANQFKVEKNQGGIILNDGEFESSYFAKNGALVTLLIEWVPIAPITLEFYNNGIQLPIDRAFSMKY